MSPDLDDVQRIVLHGSPWRAALHLMVSFDDGAPCRFLHSLRGRISGAGAAQRPAVQCSLGFTRRGLERAGVPRNVMARLALKAPAFWSGAAMRAGRHVGLSGRSAPERWHAAFETDPLDLVISLHGSSDADLLRVADEIRSSEPARRMRFDELPLARALEPPQALRQAAQKEENETGLAPQWVHFGYRDGLTRIGIVGWPPQAKTKDLLPSSIHQPGEFVLGHVADSGADPWVAGPGVRVWPQTVRKFFRNASFGVLQQVVQDVGAFESFVAKAAGQLRHLSATGDTAPGLTDEVKGKLCGRYPDGRPLAVPGGTQDPKSDFDYSLDPMGFGCPFGSHVRRMNSRTHRPRDAAPAPAPGGAAHFSRARPLLRRGLPYGPGWEPTTDGGDAGVSPERGLIGHFFCASIEDQFEHLLSEWADRVPLGSDDRGGARDPLIGAHEAADGPFDIPRPENEQPLKLHGLQAFAHTVGAAYLFYPSITTLHGIADSELWREVENDE